MPRQAVPSTALSSLPLADLHREIARRQQHHPRLRLRRDALLKEIAAIEAELGESGSIGVARRGPGRPPKAASSGRPVGRPRGPRAKNKTTLTEALAAALKGKTMGVAEAADAIRKAGYKSNAANFRIMVNGALMKKPFKRVERGKYTVA